MVGNDVLFDGSVTVKNVGDSLRQILADWTAKGATASNMANIRSHITVSFTGANNRVTGGTGNDWFFFLTSSDVTDFKNQEDFTN